MCGRELHVLDAGVVGIEQVGDDPFGGDRLKGERLDEPPGSRRHDHAHPDVELHQLADQGGRLVGGDAAGDAHQHRSTGERAAVRFVAHVVLPAFAFQVRRSPFNVIHGSTSSITRVSGAMVSASPPVASTYAAPPSSARKRATIPSTKPT